MANLQQLRFMAQMLVDARLARRGDGEALTRGDLEKTVDMVAFQTGDEIVEADRNKVVRQLEEVFLTVDQEGAEDGGAIQDNEQRIDPWVPLSKDPASWPRWALYSQYLAQRTSMAPLARQSVADWTDRILEKLPDPSNDEHASKDIRGMVVGSVQSGKTSNYLGLISKAADAGYRAILVLTGMHENLRCQTQSRVDSGFVGRDSVQGNRLIGVGELRGVLPPAGRRLLDDIPTYSWTQASSGGDFRIRADNPLAPNLVQIFVVKKNGHILRRFLRWCTTGKELEPERATPDSPKRLIEYRLKQTPYSYVGSNIPLLVIDDECDQASVDTNKGGIDDETGRSNPNHDPTTINRLIRAILRCFDRSAYVGYTATPFANVLIHDEKASRRLGADLFPRDFIVTLPVPQKYIGPSRIFQASEPDDSDEGGVELAEHLVEHVRDHAEDPDSHNCREGWLPPIHKKQHPVSELSESLKSAVVDFTLAGAGLVVRKGADEHHSMLVHCTRFQDVIERLFGQVEKHWSLWRTRVQNGDPETMEILKKRFNSSFKRAREAVVARLPWSEEQHTPIEWSHLIDGSHPDGNPLQRAVSKVSVRQIHGGAQGADLDYFEAQKRGGSLKVIAVGGNKLSRGLTLENLTTSYFLRTSRMYDTLMQMGRWFGYRPGYLDLCRLYMPRELHSWFDHMTRADEELRREMLTMAAQGATPAEFGLRVLSHSLMTVTSNVKMRDGQKVLVSFSDSRPETITYLTDARALKRNWSALKKFLGDLGKPKEQNPSDVRLVDGNSITHTFQGYRWTGVGYDLVVDFLQSLATPDTATVAHAPRNAEYIRRLAGHGELVEWTVFLRDNPQKGARREELSEEVTVGRSRRSRKPRLRLHPQVEPPGRGKSDGSFSTGVLIDSIYESLDLSAQEYEEAVRIRRLEERYTETKVPGGCVRKVRPRTRGLLLIYVVQPYDRAVQDPKLPALDIALPEDLPLVGYGISFPKSDTDEKVEYVVSNVWAKDSREMRETEDKEIDSEELGDREE